MTSSIGSVVLPVKSQKKCLILLCCSSVAIAFLYLVVLPSEGFANLQLTILFKANASPSTLNIDISPTLQPVQEILSCSGDNVLQQLGIEETRLPAYVTLESPINVTKAFSEKCAKSILDRIPRKKINLDESKCYLPLEMAKNASAQYAVARILQQEFESRNLTLILSDGSLIGSMRHFGFIPWDEDLDFLILKDQKQQVSQMLLNLSQQPGSKFEFFGTEPVMKLWKLGFDCQEKMRPEKYKVCVANVDFFFIDFSASMTRRPEAPYYFATTDILPTILRPYGPDLMLRVPHKPERFLARQYGSNVLHTCTFASHFGRHKNCRRPQHPCVELMHKYPFVHTLRVRSKITVHTVEVLLLRDQLLAAFVAK